MYQTISTETFKVEGGTIDIHVVRTENGYHYDAAIWVEGNCVEAKGEFANKVDAMKWAYLHTPVKAA